MNRPLTVIIADDHAIVREGLKLLISAMTDVSILAEAANGEALLDIVRDTRADLLTLDLGMPGVAGIQFIAEIRTLAPRMRILVLTANVEPRTVRAALEAGANGYLTKDGDPEELDQAIAALKSGRTYLAKSIRFAVERPERPGKVPVTGEIVSPIPQGLTAKLMAERLGISPLTARKHRENLMRKLSLHSTAEVTAYAVRLGLPVG